MSSLQFTRIALVAFLSFFVLVGVVLPTLRLRRRTGTTGYVAHLAPTGVHRVAIEGLRAIVFGLLLWTALFLVREPEALGVWRLPPVFTAAGWSLLALGILIVVVAQTQMGASWRVGIDAEHRTELVTTGLFSVVRNPIFTGMLAASLGIVGVTPSAWTVLGWLFLVYVLSLQVRLEEQHLAALHGERYLSYARRVGRLLPSVGRLDPARS